MIKIIKIIIIIVVMGCVKCCPYPLLNKASSLLRDLTLEVSTRSAALASSSYSVTAEAYERKRKKEE